jgi:hypothetical protein
MTPTVMVPFDPAGLAPGLVVEPLDGLLLELHAEAITMTADASTTGISRERCNEAPWSKGAKRP